MHSLLSEKTVCSFSYCRYNAGREMVKIQHFKILFIFTIRSFILTIYSIIFNICLFTFNIFYSYSTLFIHIQHLYVFSINIYLSSTFMFVKFIFTFNNYIHSKCNIYVLFQNLSIQKFFIHSTIFLFIQHLLHISHYAWK